MKTSLLLMGCIASLAFAIGTRHNKNLQSNVQNTVDLSVHGVQINVTDLEKAIDFYSNKIGFQIKSQTNGKVELQTKGIIISLREVSKPRKTNFNEETRTGLVFTN